MTRDDFMQYAEEEVHTVFSHRENALMNLIRQAWAEGKRNAEIESMTEALKKALNNLEQEKTTDSRVDFTPEQ